MSSVAVTFPGKHGDLLWALPSVRALAEQLGDPVDLFISPWIRSLVPRLRRQPYLQSVEVLEDWQTLDTAPMTPRVPPAILEHDLVLHLGYQGWPHLALPYETQATLHQQWPDRLGPVPQIDLSKPWITPPPDPWHTKVVCGWTDEWFELKVGATLAGVSLATNGSYEVVVPPGSRWSTKEAWPIHRTVCGWEEAAARIAGARVFVGDCSALHVLAVGLGVKVLLMEPNPHRHQEIFYPLGMDGPQVTVVRGNDGRPTFDARVVQQAIETALQAVSNGR